MLSFGQQTEGKRKTLFKTFVSCCCCFLHILQSGVCLIVRVDTPQTHFSNLLNWRMLGRMLMHSFGFDNAQFGEIAQCSWVARLQA